MIRMFSFIFFIAIVVHINLALALTKDSTEKIFIAGDQALINYKTGLTIFQGGLLQNANYSYRIGEVSGKKKFVKD